MSEKDKNISPDLDLMKQITEFHGKKDDVMKNINLLNTLSEKLTIAIQEEEVKVTQNKSKEMLGSKKDMNENELELLGLENKKMEGYLQILQGKQELELKYLEQLCEQRSRVDKLSEKYPHIDIKNFWTYQEYYNDQLHVSKQRTRKQLGIPKKNKQKSTHTSNNNQYPTQDEHQAMYHQYLQQQYLQQQYQQHQQQYRQQHSSSQPSHMPVADPQISQVNVTEHDTHSDVPSQHSSSNPPPPPPGKQSTSLDVDAPSQQPQPMSQAPQVFPQSSPPGPTTTNFPAFPLLNEINNASISSLRRSSMPVTRDERRSSGGLQDHLSVALDTKFQSAMRHPNEENSSESDDDNSFLN